MTTVVHLQDKIQQVQAEYNRERSRFHLDMPRIYQLLELLDILDEQLTLTQQE